jgi:polar amino acid transport system substrate-binding protein
VAIVAFSLLFGFSVFEMLKNATGNIHKGQWEGALALGFSQRQTFWQFIIPQAVRQAFPTYQAEIIGLLKSTAIVGYIAVQDLTKMADIVRAQTFDAFAPLIVITVLYLLFVWLLQKLTDLILQRLDPKHRSREDILQGVKP